LVIPSKSSDETDVEEYDYDELVDDAINENEENF
jgi:hypothetical protein